MNSSKKTILYSAAAITTIMLATILALFVSVSKDGGTQTCSGGSLGIQIRSETAHAALPPSDSQDLVIEGEVCAVLKTIESQNEPEEALAGPIYGDAQKISIKVTKVHFDLSENIETGDIITATSKTDYSGSDYTEGDQAGFKLIHISGTDYEFADYPLTERDLTRLLEDL